MKVQVLMSSYNGEKYIEEQVKSILNQKDVEVSLLVRDDGSKDSTPEILKRLQADDKRIDCVLEENLGVKRSFLKLVQMADDLADYYAFSDQDDIWIDDKLISAIRVLGKERKDIPLIYGSSVSLYMDDKIIGKQFECPPELYFGNFLIKNYYPGCTMVFNRGLKELIDKVDYNTLKPNPLHDHWINLVCTACGGKVLMDSTPHILYRQHQGNVIGDRNLIQKLKGNGLLTHSKNTRLKICQELHNLYESNEDDHAKGLIRIILNSEQGTKGKIKLAFDKEIKPLSIVEKLSIFMIAVMGKF